MTYALDVELNDPLEAALDDIVGEVEEAIHNIRGYRPERLTHRVEVDVHELLAGHRAIALVWDADMLLSHYKHLTDDQAWEVIQECERHYTAEAGLTWDDVAAAVAEMFPDPAETRHREARPERAGRVISDYVPDGDERENLVDLLTDAMHWCEGLGEPFDKFHGTARLHFAEEATAGSKGA